MNCALFPVFVLYVSFLIQCLSAEEVGLIGFFLSAHIFMMVFGTSTKPPSKNSVMHRYFDSTQLSHALESSKHTPVRDGPSILYPAPAGGDGLDDLSGPFRPTFLWSSDQSLLPPQKGREMAQTLMFELEP